MKRLRRGWAGLAGRVVLLVIFGLVAAAIGGPISAVIATLLLGGVVVAERRRGRRITRDTPPREVATRLAPGAAALGACLGVIGTGQDDGNIVGNLAAGAIVALLWGGCMFLGLTALHQHAKRKETRQERAP